MNRVQVTSIAATVIEHAPVDANVVKASTVDDNPHEEMVDNDAESNVKPAIVETIAKPTSVEANVKTTLVDAHGKTASVEVAPVSIATTNTSTLEPLQCTLVERVLKAGYVQRRTRRSHVGFTARNGRISRSLLSHV